MAQLELDRFLTLHLRSRKFPSIAAYIETVRVLAALSDRVTGRPSPRLPRPQVFPLSPVLFLTHVSPAGSAALLPVPLGEAMASP